LIKFVTLAAVVAASALASAPALAGDLRVSSHQSAVVRIPVAGKTADALKLEISNAAETVCDRPDVAKNGCVAVAVRDANRQLRAINRAHDVVAGRLEVARNDPTTIRVSLKGKTPAQIENDIDAAARSVCKASTGAAVGPAFGSCFSASVRDAKSRLAQVASNRQVASN
jgi:hypothetical protein